MEREERIYKLNNGSDTAQWAAREIVRLEKELHDIASQVVWCGCGHVTAGLRDMAMKICAEKETSHDNR